MPNKTEELPTVRVEIRLRRLVTYARIVTLPEKQYDQLVYLLDGNDRACRIAEAELDYLMEDGDDYREHEDFHNLISLTPKPL